MKREHGSRMERIFHDANHAAKAWQRRNETDAGDTLRPFVAWVVWGMALVVVVAAAWVVSDSLAGYVFSRLH